MTTGLNASHAVDHLRSVVRIAKAASVGVTGNGPRIERAEAAIDAVVKVANDLRIIRDRAAYAEARGTLMRGALGGIREQCDTALARLEGVA